MLYFWTENHCATSIIQNLQIASVVHSAMQYLVEMFSFQCRALEAIVPVPDMLPSESKTQNKAESYVRSSRIESLSTLTFKKLSITRWVCSKQTVDSTLQSRWGVGIVLDWTCSGKLPNWEVKAMTEVWGLLTIAKTFEFKIPLRFGTKHWRWFTQTQLILKVAQLLWWQWRTWDINMLQRKRKTSVTRNFW